MLESIPKVSEVEELRGPEADATPDPQVLCEVPHGATRPGDLEAVKAELSGYPARYDDLFWVNTDQGAPEYARRFAQMITDPGWVEADGGLAGEALERAAAQAARRRVWLVRSLLPRVIVDANRTWGVATETFRAASLTGVVGSFVQEGAELARIKALYDAYQAQATAAYARVCGGGGWAFNLHTYAPISVAMAAGEDLVAAVRRAYDPVCYGEQARRPVAQVITALPGGASLADAALVADLEARYAAAGVALSENEPFALHEATTTYERAAQYPGRVLILELSREALAARFVPFVPLEIDAARVEAMTRPLAQAFIARALAEG